MKKQFTILSVLFLMFFFIFRSPSDVKAISFDDTVLKSVFQIKIYDTTLKQYVSWGTGMAVGGSGTILTNYHVAKMAITNPDRYKAYACITTLLNSTPNCKHLLSITENLFGRSIGTSKYDQNFDLALLYMNQIYINGTWKPWTDVALTDWGFSLVNLSNYTKDYRDLNIGEAVHVIGYPDYGGGETIQVDGVVTKYYTDQASGQQLIVSNFKISFGNSGGPVFNSAGKLIGVTVACFVDLNGKCTDGLFIPLPTVDWWYSSKTNSKINTWEGKKSYGSKDGISQSVVCNYPLRQNAYYDPSISTDSCTCKSGYSKNLGGECVDGSGYVDPSLRYGKPIDLEAERRALNGLEDLFNKLKIPDTTQKVNLCPNRHTDPNVTNFISYQGTCLTDDEACVIKYGVSSEYGLGPNSKNVGESFDAQGFLINCNCKGGYKWNDNQTNCIEEVIVEGISNSIDLNEKDIITTEKKLITKIDNNLSKRVNGKILLQVEKNGEGWYVYPDNKKKYYLGRPADAFSIMRNLGLGIKHSELANYLNMKFPSRLSGKIMLDVEQNGEAYYINPNDLKGYYLNRPADAFRIMRELGLGITNSDIRKIDVGEVN